MSLHDVSPRWEDELRVALRWCHEVGARPGLLVVPDFHGRHPLEGSPAFVAWLHTLADTGHEVFLHGYRHLARHGDGVGYVLAQRVLSAGEAEFAALDEAEGAPVLDRGLKLFKHLGLPVHGFVPPAWTRRPWLLGALRERGVPYCEDQLFSYRPTDGARRFCPALNYASRTRARRLSSLAYARLGRGWHGLGAPVRVAIHPADLHHPALAEGTRGLLRWSLGRTVDRVQALFRAEG
ncbi:MAG: polysaccharide deacetylase family protein [Deltaproteobacteria bacterium]|nr:polysaccharide deacetylase family protein [Deltaproteobacteria bacterium]